MSSLYVFTISTTKRFEIHDSVYDNVGNPIGRIFKKSPTFKDDYDEFDYNGEYTYDVESTRDTFNKLENHEISLFDTDEYSVYPSNTFWTKED